MTPCQLHYDRLLNDSQLLHNCLTTAWQLPDNCLMTVKQMSDILKTNYREFPKRKSGVLEPQTVPNQQYWQEGQSGLALPDNFLTTNRWLPDNYPTTARWPPDNCLMTAWNMPDNFTTTSKLGGEFQEWKIGFWIPKQCRTSNIDKMDKVALRCRWLAPSAFHWIMYFMQLSCGQR